VARHDAFIWQRRWTPALRAAVVAGGGNFGAWHVLVADIGAGGSVAVPGVDWDALRAAGHAVVPVVRIDGRIGAVRAPALLAALQGTLGRLPHGVRGAVEIDHDCATARLAEYAAFLRAARAALPPGTQLAVTVLPTWLGARDFPQAAAAADTLVLQVHAIDDPALGLFDTARARHWVRALAARTDQPFLVALPAYGARVAAVQGRLVAVSAEQTAGDGAAGAEITADPAEVAKFLAWLGAAPPPGLRGVVWFRLATGDDRRAWSAATLRAVMQGGDMSGHAMVAMRAGDAGATDIFVTNPGGVDVPVPLRIALPAGCVAADGIGQYVLDGFFLRARGHALLPAHEAVPAGWMRCGGAEGLHVEQ
jgi:hypothetical protein